MSLFECNKSGNDADDKGDDNGANESRLALFGLAPELVQFNLCWQIVAVLLHHPFDFTLGKLLQSEGFLSVAFFTGSPITAAHKVDPSKASAEGGIASK